MKKQLTTVLGILTVSLFALFIFYLVSAIIMIFILPAVGYRISTTSGTGSMEPLMMGKTLLLTDTNVGFDELKVGDIIIYKERADSNFARSEPRRSNFYKKGEKPPEPEITYKDDGIEYSPKDSIVHRIVEIIDGHGDRALICKGDNNPENDPYPVLESAYVGKVIWSKSHLGAVFSWLYRDGGALWLLGAFVLVGVGFIVLVRKDG